MRKNRWSNLFGDILAIGTVSTVALSAKHVAKKYGQKYKGISINGLYLLDYAAGRIFGDGAKAQEMTSAWKWVLHSATVFMIRYVENSS